MLCKAEEMHEVTEARQDQASPVNNAVTISVRNLGKCYRIYDTPRDRLRELLSFGKRSYHRKFWGLRNVSFDMRRGETIGIVGRNGAGKSTLLQIVCGIARPTEGSVRYKGEVAALLELGTGLSPQFTGRENVYMKAALMGLSDSEIDSVYDSIVEFADIGEFIDRQVKTYSSGMRMRLAFAVAVSIDPDILVIDEILSVGDVLFQRKCYSRIRQMKENGATILFVSHSAQAVIELCDRAILLDRGNLILDDIPKTVVSKYHQLLYAPQAEQERIRSEIIALNESGSAAAPHPVGLPSSPQEPIALKREVTPGKAFYEPNLVPKSRFRYHSRGATISEPCIITLEGVTVNNLIRREDYIYTYAVDFHETAFSVQGGMLIKNMHGVELGGAVTADKMQSIPVVDAGTRLRVRFKFKCLLLPGTYFLNAGVFGVVDGQGTYLDRLIDAVVIKVQPEKEKTATAIVDFLIEPCVEVEVDQA